MTSREILKKHWGFSEFRPLQEEIINSVLNDKDTLALLPTGGGKSICFQVPALSKKGICIVISPLIALMKDQVDNLKRKGIKALAITSTLTKKEIDIALDNCVYGNYKFLYVSPERLQTDLFKERVKKMNVNLIAVDEAHCISQWGYDFRPEYLKIAELKELIPDVAVLALTATATPDVVKDIQQKLLFKKENCLQKSFERTNLSYVVLQEENKLSRLLNVLNKVQGTGIVYVRNRKKTVDVARYLAENKISADYYHAGLDPKQRELKQQNWIKNQTRVIVCTNAFGMGIDKPDVRVVVHLDIPDSIEAYFQEAGRAGRDEKKAFAIMLYNNADQLDLQHQLDLSFPPIEEIKKIYNSLGNFFQLHVGTGEETVFQFDISTFCLNFKLNAITVFSSLKLLELDGYLKVSEAVYQPSRIKFITKKDQLENFIQTNATFDDFIKVMLRSYTGAFDHFVKINEQDISKRTGFSIEETKKKLSVLHSFQIIEYSPQNSHPQVTYLTDRKDLKNLTISKEIYRIRKERAQERLNAVFAYATSQKCRSKQLLNYFGEDIKVNCGSCDYCLNQKKTLVTEPDFINVSSSISTILSAHSLTIEQLVKKLEPVPEVKSLQVIRWLIENEQIKYVEDNKLAATN